jgi:hypothetical protein
MANNKTRFTALYNKIHDPKNGYFSKEGIPYHSVEKLMVEAPDHGHQTTSEALSYYVWNEAVNGKITGNWTGLQKAWDAVEKLIPQQVEQPSNDGYNPSKPATYAAEYNKIEQYPSKLDTSVPVGSDPIGNELKQKHGSQVYAMHWMKDCDNFYKFETGDKSVFINTFQRGEHESCWKTIPQPSIEKFQAGGKNGYLDIFAVDPSGSYSKQYKYTIAPDADARLIQAVYWAKKWADQKGGSTVVNTIVAKAAKMGDWLRYCMFDKYFKKIGCQSKTSEGALGYDSAHYLLSWYYAFGGPITPQGWGWKIGCSHSHFGYQNPFAAWILATQKSFTNNMCPNAPRDWNKSLLRQIQLYSWLQSAEGGIAGGVTNSLNGDYQKYPVNLPTFFNMIYTEQPVYIEPPSNGWFGFQTWSMERVAQYYYETKDAKVLPLLKKWATWANTNIKWTPTVSIPASLTWTGAPDTSFSGTGIPVANKNLHVKIATWNQDIGIIASLVRCFLYIGYANNDKVLITSANKLIESIVPFADTIGYSTPEPRPDYINKATTNYITGFNTPVYVPPTFKGKMPNGDIIDSKSTFISLRSAYKLDPDYKKIEDAYKTGTPPVFHYHRFWGQSEILLTFGLSVILQEQSVTPTPVPTPTPTPTPKPPTPTPTPTPKPPTPTPTPKPPTPTNNLSFISKVTNSWQEGGKAITQYDVVVHNDSKNIIKNATIKIVSPKIRSLWNLQGDITQQKFTFPTWLPNGLQPNEQFTFGFISEDTATISIL